MRKIDGIRRGLVTGFIGLLSGLIFHRSAKSSSLATPDATEGPFYPTAGMRLSDDDNDLVKIAERVKEAGGEVLVLTGTLKNREGDRLAGRRVEIWQCDLNGKYLHPGDDRKFVHDQGFQGFGHDITDENGRYRFRTIKPASYPGRTPHIHVKILDGDAELLTTQFYIRDHPGNVGDSLYSSMSASEADRVSMTIADVGKGLETRIDIVV